MAKGREDPSGRLDDAARAGWLYYVAGNTQDEIAAKLGISRQAAQRLVSLSVSAGLVRVRIEHPVAACLDLARQLQDRFDLAAAEVVLSDPGSASTTLGVADACAARLTRELARNEPQVIGLGTGRTLRAAIERLAPVSCPQHRIVSLTGNIASDGRTAVYNVIFTMADKIDAPHYPMPLPVIASSAAERSLLHRQKVVRISRDLAAKAHLALIGIGGMGADAPLILDRYISDAERDELIAAGAVGEIIGWAFDAHGNVLDCALTKRVVSVPIPFGPATRVVAVAMGRAKREAILGALRGRLVQELITDEETARALLSVERSSLTSSHTGAAWADR